MDESKLGEFMARLVGDMGGAAMLTSVVVGEELGHDRAMADGAPVTADALSASTACRPRLVREWIDAQATSGDVEYADGAYRLPEEQAMALAIEDSPVDVAGGAGVAPLPCGPTGRAVPGHGHAGGGDAGSVAGAP